MLKKDRRKIRVAVAMSGGVDSSLAAALLVREGYDCTGIFYELWSEETKLGKGWENNCCSLEAYHDAKKVARNLDIPLFRADISDLFKKKVVDYFIEEYQKGRTPNPCVVCNSELRFGAMLERALKTYKANYLATGHYAIKDHADSWRKKYIEKVQFRHKLIKGSDLLKDQTYFLYRIKQAELKKVIFPLGGLTKAKVRMLAAQINLPTASKHDSQEVCFIPKSGTNAFLKRHIGGKSGLIVDPAGHKIGSHAGLNGFTVGQRHGLGALGQKPHYVLKKNVTTNTLVASDNLADLKMTGKLVELENVNFIDSEPGPGQVLQARARHLQELFDCYLVRIENKLYVKILSTVELLAPGQSLVLYCNHEVLGGGIIKGVISHEKNSKKNQETFEDC